MPARAHGDFLHFAAALAILAAACSSSSKDTPAPPGGDPQDPLPDTVRIVYLHHSTGLIVWNGGVPAAIQSWNDTNGKSYTITEMAYPDDDSYGWANYPYDYWNLWVNYQGDNRYSSNVPNLDDLAADYDVIVWKHCYPVVDIGPDGTSPIVSSSEKTIANYKLQYEELKTRMLQFPDKRFIVWTGAARVEGDPEADDVSAGRARQFFTWVKEEWDDSGDNIYVWDFYELETEGGLYLKTDYAESTTNSHPSAAFSATVAPLIAKRIVDVIEGRGDTGSLIGQ